MSPTLDSWHLMVNNGSNLRVFQSNDGTRYGENNGERRRFSLRHQQFTVLLTGVFGITVRDVKFSDTSNGSPLQIILTLQNGSFQMYDGNGSRYNGGNND